MSTGCPTGLFLGRTRHSPWRSKNRSTEGGGILCFSLRMIPDVCYGPSGGSLLFDQYAPFAILKPKNRKTGGAGSGDDGGGISSSSSSSSLGPSVGLVTAEALEASSGAAASQERPSATKIGLSIALSSSSDPPPFFFFPGGHLNRCLRRPVLIVGKSGP